MSDVFVCLLVASFEESNTLWPCNIFQYSFYHEIVARFSIWLIEIEKNKLFMKNEIIYDYLFIFHQSASSFHFQFLIYVDRKSKSHFIAANSANTLTEILFLHARDLLALEMSCSLIWFFLTNYFKIFGWYFPTVHWNQVILTAIKWYFINFFTAKINESRWKKLDFPCYNIMNIDFYTSLFLKSNIQNANQCYKCTLFVKNHVYCNSTIYAMPYIIFCVLFFVFHVQSDINKLTH